MKLSGKVALITGAARGMGRATALLFAEEGADVAASDINFPDVEKTVEDIRAMGRKAIAIKADVSEAADVQAMLDRVIHELGGIHILVNNAGIGMGAPAIELKIETWDKIVKTNLRSCFLCSQGAGKWMIDHGGGTILNIASIGGIEGAPTLSGYGPSKAGVINLTRVLAVEWAKYNIRVNCIAPGAVMTQILKDSLEFRHVTEDAFLVRIPLGRIGEPEDIAKAALFLVSDDANYITGVTLPVDGGSLCYGHPS